ncbi:MAG: Gfo/Idh/MocA family oxidoreductase [Pseudomonadota bacterium]
MESRHQRSPIERVLIVGLGSIGRRHLALARELLPQADIRVLRRTKHAELAPGANALFSALPDAVAFAPQLSIIANPAPFHLPVAMALAEAGSHLLLEKPIAHSSRGVAELIALSARRKVRLHIAYNLRFLASLQRFRECVHSGQIGHVHTIRCEVGQYLPSWRPEQDYRATVSAQAALGGGVLLELSHEIDYLRWIFGELEWVHGNLLRQGALEIDVEDSAHLLLGFVPRAGEQQAVANVSLDFIRRDTTRYCLALGSEGSLRWDGISGQLMHYTPEQAEWRELFAHTPKRDDTYRMQLENMLDGIASGVAPAVTGSDALAVMQIIEAIRLSAQEGGRRMSVYAQNRQVP